MEISPPPHTHTQKKIFFVKLGIFCLELEKNILIGIGNGADFRPQNRVIESPAFAIKVDMCESF